MEVKSHITGTFEERHKLRLAWRNEFNLYKAKCAKSGIDIFSMYRPEQPFPVYSPDAWYSDGWDPLDYGQDYDFNRPFFEQFAELQSKVPRLSNIVVGSENCDYCNIIGYCKNSYLIFGSVECENCLYGSPYQSKDCVDSLSVHKCQWCYECIDSESLYECFYCQNCNNSSNLEFCFDVDSSRNCFLCVGLRQAEYCILNQKYSATEYESKKQELKKMPAAELFAQLDKLQKTVPIKYYEGSNNENITGNHLNNCKNCFNSFHLQNCENVENCTQILSSYNCYDSDFGEFSNNVVGTSGFYKAVNIAFCHWCWEISDCYYCSICYGNTQNCFGSIGLKKKQYCILNKQYTKEQYEQLLPQIISHMQQTGEWGQFFPLNISPFPYSDTIAEVYYPQTQVGQSTGKPFVITKAESEFYRKYNLPNPLNHPTARYKDRVSKRAPKVINTRSCSNCHIELKTAYSDGDILCESCYLSRAY